MIEEFTFALIFLAKTDFCGGGVVGIGGIGGGVVGGGGGGDDKRMFPELLFDVILVEEKLVCTPIPIVIGGEIGGEGGPTIIC